MQESATSNPCFSADASNDPAVLAAYDPGLFFDEAVDAQGRARPEATALIQLINQLPPGELQRRQSAIEKALYRMGITFTVYSDNAGTEKIMPFDIVPRILPSSVWSHIECGLRQRISALNQFLTDVYQQRRIINEGVIPAEIIDSCDAYLPQCRDLHPPNGVWCHITGTDLVRDDAGDVYVLEDNLRCPSGVSYVLQNRSMMKRNFPHAFTASQVRPVSDYPARLYQMLLAMAPDGVAHPTVVVLTPGVYNSAYYEHSFLAHQMGVELVEGRDLVVRDDRVFMKTTSGLERVDVIYRRVDDTFLDPEVFNPKSVLGVPGLMRAYRAGNIALANAPGTGIADDKVVYAYVPEMIRFYLGQEPILKNVPTFVCQRDEDRDHVLANLHELVVKAAGESGGYGILIGPHATDELRCEFAAKIRENPRNYVAQPTLQLSRVPTMTEGKLEGRHVDLRPYILCSGNDDIWVLPGGLTRVALKKGSLVVNSSQGGGSKDTWVIAQPGQRVAAL
ncbi:MAG: circularly permuted type 2 ATP-grasp protein [Planctomycetota bacterium]